MRLRRGVAVLHRAPGVTQVGLARPVVIDGLTEADQRALAALEGGRVAPTRFSPAARRGLADAAKAGHMLDEGGRRRGVGAPGTVAVHGAGAIGIAAARALAREGAEIEFADAAPAIVEPPGVFAAPARSQTCAVAATRDVLAAVPGAAVRVGTSAPDAAILIGVGAPDPVAWLPLLRADVPHVLVTTDESGVDVGPLVVPGATACAACLAIARTAEDAAWPALALQCGASRRPSVEPHVAEAAGALAAAMLMAHGTHRESAQDEQRSAWAWAVNAVWRVEPGRPPLARPAWPQPDCGCGAAEAVETSAMSSAPYLSSLDAPMP